MPITLTLVFRPFTDPPPEGEKVFVLYSDRTIITRCADYVVASQALGWCELPTLPEPEDEWVTPTDEDALRRPECQVKDHEDASWTNTTLVHVAGGSYPFMSIAGCFWRYCRIRKPKPATVAEPEPEQWVEPTNGDALKQPACEYRDSDSSAWKPGVLVGVGEAGDMPRFHYRFGVQTNRGFDRFSQCRIKAQPK